MASELSSSNFKEFVSKGWVLVDFWAPWCGPCRMLGPVIDELSHEMKGIKVGKVNVDEQGDLSGQFEVMSIPTLILFKDGQVADRRVGAGTKPAIKGWIEEAMS